MRLDAVRPLFDHPGPFLTVGTDVGRPDEHGLDRRDARWTTIRHRLEHLGVDGRLVSRIGDRVRENPHVAGEARRTLVAVDGEIVFDEVYDGSGTSPADAEIEPLPDLGGWLAHEDRVIGFLLVRADRTGAEIDLYRATGAQRIGRPLRHESVSGESFQITKVPEGDWAQLEYQRRAEGLWQRNAEDVVEVMTSLVRAARPQVVLAAGDVRAQQLIADAWTNITAPLFKLESGGRAHGVSEEALEEEVQRVLAAFAADADRELAERLAEGQAHDRVAAGADAVVDALVTGQVDQVVLDPVRAAELTVRPAEHPGLELPEAAVGKDELPADRVVVAAAARTGAEVRLIDGSLVPGDGVAALLRWARD